jgi:hypothetical protein
MTTSSVQSGHLSGCYRALAFAGPLVPLSVHVHNSRRCRPPQLQANRRGEEGKDPEREQQVRLPQAKHIALIGALLAFSFSPVALERSLRVDIGSTQRAANAISGNSRPMQLLEDIEVFSSAGSALERPVQLLEGV